MTKSDRIRRIIASPDGASDVLVLTDAPTVSIYKRTGAPLPSSSLAAAATSSSASAASPVPLYSLRSEPTAVLPNAPMDASWCPYKQGDANSSFLATSWGSAVRLVDVDDGTVRGTYYAANTMDEVAFAQSVLWLRAPNRQEQFVAGYGRPLECCVALFDVMREGKNPIYTYEPSAAKCCNFSTDASSSNVIVSAMAEMRSNLMGFGTLRGSVEFVDLRSRCCAGAISGATASGSGNVMRGAAASANFVRHTAGVVQLVALDGPSLSTATPSLVNSSGGAASSSSGPTASDDHRFITVPRGGDGNILAWDMRYLANPVSIVRRNDSRDGVVSSGGLSRNSRDTNVLRNVEVMGNALLVPTYDAKVGADAIASIPLATIFGSTAATGTSSSSSSGVVATFNATDYLEHSFSVLSLGSSASGEVAKTVCAAVGSAFGAGAGPMAVVANGAALMVAATASSSAATSSSINGDAATAVSKANRYMAVDSGMGQLGAKRIRSDKNKAGGDEEDEEEDYVVLRSRRAYGKASTSAVDLSDDEA